MSTSVPEPLAYIAGVFASFDRWWALCGGWAVDAWLARETRPHGDIDITVFADDQLALLEHLKDWNLIAHDEVEPMATEPWDGRPLVLPAHLHARPPGEENRRIVLAMVTPPYKGQKDGREIEYVINERDGDDWVFHPGKAVRRPIERCVRESAWGLPTVAPEVIAFYKATAYYLHPKHWNRPQDVGDFPVLLTLLGEGERNWLRDAIASMHPEHPWLEQLR